MNTTVTSVNFRLISTIPISWTVIVKRWATPNWCEVVMDENIKYPMWSRLPETSAILGRHDSSESIGVAGPTRRPTTVFSAYWLTPTSCGTRSNRKIPSWMNTRAKFNPDKEFKGSEGSRYNAYAHSCSIAGMVQSWIITWVKSWKSWKKGWKTLVIFSSDNGPHEEGGSRSYFLRQRRKAARIKTPVSWRGGIRIPFIARWPGHIPAGKVNDHICAFYDLMPTFCEVIGIKDYEKKYGNKEKEIDYFDGISFCSHTAG